MSQESVYSYYSFLGHTASQVLLKKHMTYLQHLSNRAVWLPGIGTIQQLRPGEDESQNYILYLDGCFQCLLQYTRHLTDHQGGSNVTAFGGQDSACSLGKKKKPTTKQHCITELFFLIPSHRIERSFNNINNYRSVIIHCMPSWHLFTMKANNSH